MMELWFTESQTKNIGLKARIKETLKETERNPQYGQYFKQDVRDLEQKRCSQLFCCCFFQTLYAYSNCFYNDVFINIIRILEQM